jgi:Zn-dependent M28 family amino/carboxypeptidase
MRTPLLLLCIVACRSATPAVQAPLGPSGMAADIAYLASRALQGRAAGTPGNDSAAVFLARRHRALELPGAFPGACAAAEGSCPSSYFQTFTGGDVSGRNVGAFIRGSDDSLHRQFVVVGAHFDHLGTSPRYSRDPELQLSVRPGADDNASGTAAVLELARRLSVSPPPRSVIIVHFDAEEHGLVGSGAFVQRLPAPRSTIVFMLNLDMVGRLNRRDVLVDGSAADGQTRALADSVARALRIRAARTTASAGRSDHAAFGWIGVPALSLTSGFHADYHRASDVASRIDHEGLGRIVDLAEGIVRAAATRTWTSRRSSSIDW